MNFLDENYYARWLDTDSLLKNNSIGVIDNTSSVETIGLPIGSINDKIIVDKNIDSTIVIGDIGSGKTQSTILPMLEQASLSNESIFVVDPDNTLYLNTSKKFENNGFKVININLKNLDVSNNWNPFYIVSKLYNNGKEDDAYRLLNTSLSYLLAETNKNADPFWANTASQYLTGIILSLIEKNVDIEKINFKTLTKFTTEYTNEDVAEYLDNLDKSTVAYKNIASTYLAPFDTKGSIMSVLNQKLTEIIGRKKLVSILARNDFDITNIRKEKSIIYLTYDCTNIIDCSLCNILLEQLFYVVSNDEIKNPYTFLIDDFDSNQKPIINFNNKLSGLRRVYAQAVLFVRGFELLNRVYDKEDVEILKYQCNNILYLISKEYSTLDFISNFCGKKNETDNLVSTEALRRMPMWSAIYIKSRIMPYFGKLVPYYTMNIENIPNEYHKNSIQDVEVINLENI